MSDRSMLNFNYTVSEISSTSLSLDLKFVSPEYVSVTPDKENLIVRLQNLRDANGDLIVESSELRT